MKKIALSIISIWCLFNFANAQENVTDIVERISNAQYIFEGKVIFSKSYERADEKDIYTTNTIEITKVFKGNLQCGKIEVISQGGSVDDKIVTHSHLIEMKEGYTGIFMCGLNDKELPAIDYIIEENIEKLYPIFENQSFVKYYYEGMDLKIADYTFNLDSLVQVYNLFETVTQIQYIDCNNSAMVLPVDNVPLLAAPYNPDPMPIYSKADYDKVMDNMQYKKQRQAIKNERSNVTLTYTFGPSIITGTNPKYLEFDVNISHSDISKYFNNGLVRLKYNTNTFGANIVANNKIQVNRGTVIADATVYQNPTPADITSDVVAIPLSSLYPNGNLYPLTTTPTQAVHIKMQISNCNGTTISFTDQSIMEILSFYGDNASDTFGVSYDAIVANSSFTVPACVPTITSFSPNPINGGNKEKLIIKGYQFGNNPKVYFPNADDNGQSMAILDSTDISPSISQTNDTIITITMPSFCDSSSGLPTITKSVPGSGYFKVYGQNGVVANSHSPLQIFYSWINHRTPLNNTKNRVYLIGKDANQGYEFRVDTALWNHADRRACVLKAVNDWKCLTGVKWDVVGSIAPTSDTPFVDGLNVIQLGVPSTSSLGLVLADTRLNEHACNVDIFASELDLTFNKNLNWWYDTTRTQGVPAGKRDFYAVLMHELGHAHGLAHIIDSNAIMHCFDRSWTPLPANKRKIYLSNDASCDVGGNSIMQKSAAVSFLCGASAPLTIIRQQLCSPISRIESIKETMADLEVYPNPAIDYITVNYTVIKDTKMDMLLMDYAGNIIAKSELQPVKAGSYQSTISLESVPTGNYLLWGHVGNSVYHKTIIHIAG